MDILSEVKKAIKYSEDKNYEKAEKIYLEILKQDKSNAVILSFLGLLYLKAGLFKKAEKYLEKSNNLKANKATIEGLGLVKYYLSEYEEACKYLEIAIKNNRSFDIYDKFVKSLYETKLYSKSYEYALECYNKYPFKEEALGNLALSCIGVGKLKECMSYAEKLIQKYPKYGKGWLVFGLINEILYHNDLFARECYKNSLKYGDKLTGYYNLAVNASKLKDYKKAYYYACKFKKLASNQGNINFLIATIYFYQKKFKKGYSYYVKKEEGLDKSKPASKLKNIWSDGKTYKEDTLMVYCDQGIGDCLMFARYLPFLEKKFKRIKVYTNKVVLSLLKRSFKQYVKLEFLPFKLRFPHYDKSAVLSNIPCYLNMGLTDIPFRDGYLISDNKKTETYNTTYFKTDKLKVGICWEAGAAGLREQLNRTLNISMFEPLFALKNIQYYSFQVNPSLDNYKNYKQLVDLGSNFKDFDDTAAALKNLDVMVTVDTSVAHLAGALGVKTFMLLPYCPDWRWFDSEHDTEWYSSIRIFKQKNNVLWEDVINNVVLELKKLSM